jgi:hypothetical protein
MNTKSPLPRQSPLETKIPKLLRPTLQIIQLPQLQEASCNYHTIAATIVRVLCITTPVAAELNTALLACALVVAKVISSYIP